MRVASDLGGVAGFGPVDAEVDEPVFHAAWEKRIFALTLAMGATGTWTLDASRFAREDRPSAEYLSMSYYELWAAALERLLVEHGLVSAIELQSGEARRPPASLRRHLEGAEVRATLRRGANTSRPPVGAPKFTVGDRVRTSTAGPTGHTRLPSYARGKVGTVIAVHGCHVFPDTNAVGAGEQPRWLYAVEFPAIELFGGTADPRATVNVDTFEPYVETA